MEIFIDYEYLIGTQNVTFIKELSIAAENVIETFQFQTPYAMRPHGDTVNGPNWDDGHIPYNPLSTVLSEAVAGFAHLYVYGDSKCTLLSQLLGCPVNKLEDLNCHLPHQFRHRYSCTKPCHRNPSFLCATRRANFLYEWLLYQVQKMTIVTWIDDKASYCPLCFSII